MKSTEGLITLFRPTGLAELALVFDSKMKEFPPRLREQPIFYPVLNQTYAAQIAREWNTKSPPNFAGYVTRFQIDGDYAAQFPTQTVGSGTHQELWVPAERLPEFNSKILGCIQTVEAYFGNQFTGFVPDGFGLRGKNATDQFVCLAGTFDYSGMDFVCETAANAKSVYLNFPFWSARDFEALGVTAAKKLKVLDAISKLWQQRLPLIPLCRRGF